MKWTIKTKDQFSIGLIESKTKDGAIQQFIETWDNVSRSDILYAEPSKRYVYAVVEEGIMDPKLQGYVGGRVEVEDLNDRSAYPVYEWRFLVPIELFEKFCEFIDGAETSQPTMISSEFNMDTLEYEF